MSLDAGGHLTHGFRPNISGKMFDQRSYGTDPETGLIDYDALRRGGPRVPAADPRRRLLRVPAQGQLPRSCARSPTRSAPPSWSTWRTSPAWSPARCFTGDFDPVPHAHIVTTTTHKSLRGPRGGMVLCQPELADHVDRGCPMVLGGPLPHVMAAKAVALAEARRPDFADYAQRIVDNAAGARRGAAARGARQLVTGGTDNHLVLIDVDRLRAHRPPGRAGAAGLRHRHQPQLGPAGPERRLVHLRHPARHPGADHPRPRHRRDGRDRRADPHRADQTTAGATPTAPRRRRSTRSTRRWPTRSPARRPTCWPASRSTPAST